MTKKEQIRKDLVRCYSTEEEMITMVESVMYKNSDMYKHLLDCYHITVADLEAIFIDMGYIEP